MASKNTLKATNGEGRRHLPSWIESFVKFTENLESAPIWREWSAISLIAAVLQRKVWVTTGTRLYPNLYVFLVGHAGTGKSKSINSALRFCRTIPEIHLSPSSVTMAALTDCLDEAKRIIPLFDKKALEYNSIWLAPDELSALMEKYDGVLVGGLTTLYDNLPYSQGRRVGNIRIDMPAPQVNMLAGATPAFLNGLFPAIAWEQGFLSRVIMVWSTERPLINLFTTTRDELPDDMIHDLAVIDSLVGEMGWTDEFRDAAHEWKMTGMDPAPTHPKLTHYCTRRWAHLVKLAMISCIDRGNNLVLEVIDYRRALKWLVSAEHFMPLIFATGSIIGDSRAMEEIVHYVAGFGAKGVPEHKVKRFACGRIQTQWVGQTINMMQESGMIKSVSIDESKQRVFIVGDPPP